MSKNQQNVTSLPTAYGSRNAEITVAGDGRPPLREDWVERIFAVLAAGFGRQFSDQWSGVDPAEMKSLWSRKLAGYFDQPEAIRKALDEATNAKFPPNVGEFLAICQKHYVSRRADDRFRVPRGTGRETFNPDVVERLRDVLAGKVSA